MYLHLRGVFIFSVQPLTTVIGHGIGAFLLSVSRKAFYSVVVATVVVFAVDGGGIWSGVVVVLSIHLALIFIFQLWSDSGDDDMVLPLVIAMDGLALVVVTAVWGESVWHGVGVG